MQTPYSFDAIVYASSQFKNLILVTGDPHFRSLPDIEII
jgi:hypothetical protein